MEIIYQNRRGIPPLAYCCHLVLVVGCSDLFPHLGAQRHQFVQGSSMGTTQKEIAAAEQEEENGADGDDEEGMADAEGEED